MKKLLIALIVLILLAAGAGIGAYVYVSPEEELDLAFSEVPLRDRAIDMVKRLSTDLIMSEQDVNDLAKAELAGNPRLSRDLEITGIRLELKDGFVEAHANVIWKSRIPVGLVVQYRLSWQPPMLVLVPTEAKAKDISLPLEWLEAIDIPLGDRLPETLRIESVEAGEGKLTVSFRRPNARELQEMLGF